MEEGTQEQEVKTHKNTKNPKGTIVAIKRTDKIGAFTKF